MRHLLATAAAVLALMTAAHAEPMVGKKLAAGSDGQPICVSDMDDLKEFMMAALTNDKAQLGAILKEGKCTMLKRGTAIAVLEDFGDTENEMHAIKIRAMANGKSVVGYSLSIGMDPRK